MKKGTLLVTLSYVLWGIFPVFWKLLAGIDSVYLLCYRVTMSCAAALIAALIMGDFGRIKAVLRDKKLLKRLFWAGVAVCVNWGLYIYCVTQGHLLDSSLAYYINPILSILIGFFFFKERLNALQWASVALAAAGVMVPIFIDGSFPLLAIAIGLAFALYGAIKKGVDLPGEVGTFTETLLMSPFAVAVIVIMEANGGPIASGVISGWRLLLLPAAGAVTFLPLAMYSSGLRTTPLSLSGILMYINPTIQLLLGVLLYDEKMTTASVITFALVFAAVVLFVVGGNSGKKKTAECSANDMENT